MTSYRQLSKALWASLLWLIALSTFADCLGPARLTGVNLAGAEFNSKKLPGVAFKDYTYPSAAELAFIAQQGANMIRLPFRWERIQHELNGALDHGELQRLQTTISQAQAHNLCVLLDLHNYAKYHSEPLTSPALQEGFVALWLALAEHFDEPSQVAFGLMNEPAYMPLADWAALAQHTLAQLRGAGAQNLVLLGGGGWNGLHSWFSQSAGSSNASALADLYDPLKRTLVEVHQYADSNYSGTQQDCYPPEHFEAKFARISQWAKDQQLQLFLGEFGVAATPACLATLEHFLHLMQGSEWKGWSYWAAGRWWGNYPFALNADAENPSPQWGPLKRYFYSGFSNPPLPPTEPLQAR